MSEKIERCQELIELNKVLILKTPTGTKHTHTHGHDLTPLRSSSNRVVIMTFLGHFFRDHGKKLASLMKMSNSCRQATALALTLYYTS